MKVMHTVLYSFPDEEEARRFVRRIVTECGDVAILIVGCEVRVVDGSKIHKREILRLARDFEGEVV